MIGLLRGATPGDTAARVIVSLLVLTLIGSLAYGLISGRFWAWRAGVWKERAQEAAGEAKAARQAAKSSDAGATNATTTRGRMDELVIDVRGLTEIAAEQAEREADASPDPVEPLSDDDLADLEEAEARIEARARKLRGKR